MSAYPEVIAGGAGRSVLRRASPLRLQPVGNGYTAVPVGGEAVDETPERQRSLFSWAEFMAEEPAEPKRRSRRPEPASISLFEWALEREREAVPVGAGRQAGSRGGGHRS